MTGADTVQGRNFIAQLETGSARDKKNAVRIEQAHLEIELERSLVNLYISQPALRKSTPTAGESDFIRGRQPAVRRVIS